MNPPLPPELTRILEECLRHEDWHVRIAALVEKLGPEVLPPEQLGEVLLGRVKDHNSGVRQAALWVLKDLGPEALTPQLTEALVECLRDDNKRVCQAALQVLGKLGPETLTAKACQAIVERMMDERWTARQAALEVLAALKPLTRGLTQVMVQRLRDRNSDMRKAALQVLGELGPEALTPQLTEALVECLRDDNKRVCQAALQVLRKLGPVILPPEKFGEILLERLRDEDLAVRQEATWIWEQWRWIADEACRRLAPRSSLLLCPHCLIRLHRHQIRWRWGKLIYYYGCRACRQAWSGSRPGK